MTLHDVPEETPISPSEPITPWSNLPSIERAAFKEEVWNANRQRPILPMTPPPPVVSRQPSFEARDMTSSFQELERGFLMGAGHPTFPAQTKRRFIPLVRHHEASTADTDTESEYGDDDDLFDDSMESTVAGTGEGPKKKPRPLLNIPEPESRIADLNTPEITPQSLISSPVLTVQGGDDTKDVDTIDRTDDATSSHQRRSSRSRRIGLNGTLFRIDAGIGLPQLKPKSYSRRNRLRSPLDSGYGKSSKSTSEEEPKKLPSPTRETIFKKKRRGGRMIRACAQCHKSKVRCEGGFPCRRCIDRGEPDLCIRRSKGDDTLAVKENEPTAEIKKFPSKKRKRRSESGTKALADRFNRNRGVLCKRSPFCRRPNRHPGHCGSNVNY